MVPDGVWYEAAHPPHDWCDSGCQTPQPPPGKSRTSTVERVPPEAATLAWIHHSLPCTPLNVALNAGAEVVELELLLVVVVDELLPPQATLPLLRLPSSQVKGRLCDWPPAESWTRNSTLLPATLWTDEVQAPHE